MVLGGGQNVHRHGGRAQVIVEQAGSRRLQLIRAILGSGELTSVSTQQVMHAIPAWPGRLDQVRPGQLIQQSAAALKGGAGERGDRVRLKIGTGMQGRQPESAIGLGAQVPTRPGEHGPYRGTRVPVGVQQVQPSLLVGQFTGQVSERDDGVRGGKLGGHPKRQRQPRALISQHGRGGGVRVHPAANQCP
jgi:hypothetical protein